MSETGSSEPRYVRVRNWAKFQHYHDRHPPWIKNYTNLDDRANPFSRLSFSTQGKLQAIWRLAAKLDNMIPYDGRYVCKAIGAKDIPWASLLEAEWVQIGTQKELKRLQKAEETAANKRIRASNRLAARKQSATPEGEREKEPPSPPTGKVKCPKPHCGLWLHKTRIADHLRNVHDEDPPAHLRAVA